MVPVHGTKANRRPPDMKAGRRPPDELYAIIEIPRWTNVKYEFDSETGLLFVDRVLYTAMFFPFNYGLIPHTIEEDGDPVDVVVVSNESFVPGAVVSCRPIGMLVTMDEKGVDNKLITVPSDRIDPEFKKVREVRELPAFITNQIRDFFKHYKALEPGKWVKVKGWRNSKDAKKMVMEALKRYEEREKNSTK